MDTNNYSYPKSKHYKSTNLYKGKPYWPNSSRDAEMRPYYALCRAIIEQARDDLCYHKQDHVALTPKHYKDALSFFTGKWWFNLRDWLDLGEQQTIFMINAWRNEGKARQRKAGFVLGVDK